MAGICTAAWRHRHNDQPTGRDTGKGTGKDTGKGTGTGTGIGTGTQTYTQRHKHRDTHASMHAHKKASTGDQSAPTNTAVGRKTKTAKIKKGRQKYRRAANPGRQRADQDLCRSEGIEPGRRM